MARKENMKELESLDQFLFIEARKLIGSAYLEDHGVTQVRTVAVEKVISAVDALSWQDTMSRLPGVYVEQLIIGEIQPNPDPPILYQHNGVFIAYSLGWKIALAKLKGLKEIEALILCYD